jgi:hypothetical protein
MPSVGLRLNEWTEQVTRWLDMSVWADGGAPLDTNWRDVKADLDELEERLAERRCYGELDLARVNDLTAFVLVFPPQEDSGLGRIGGRWVVVPRFWVPEETFCGGRGEIGFHTTSGGIRGSSRPRWAMPRILPSSNGKFSIWPADSTSGRSVTTEPSPARLQPACRTRDWS